MFETRYESYHFKRAIYWIVTNGRHIEQQSCRRQLTSTTHLCCSIGRQREIYKCEFIVFSWLLWPTNYGSRMAIRKISWSFQIIYDWIKLWAQCRFVGLNILTFCRKEIFLKIYLATFGVYSVYERKLLVYRLYCSIPVRLVIPLYRHRICRFYQGWTTSLPSAQSLSICSIMWSMLTSEHTPVIYIIKTYVNYICGL